MIALGAALLAGGVAAGGVSGHVSALAWDGSNLWVGEFDGGLVRSRGGRWERVATPGPPQASWVNALCWHAGFLWVGSNHGLGRWDPGTDAVLAVPEVRGPVNGLRRAAGRLVVAGADAVWIGGDRGWQRLDLAGESLHAAVHVGTEVWAGGLRGVLRRDGERWRRYSELNGALPDSWVTALEPVGAELWVGTYDAGLLALDHRGTVRTLRSGEWVNPGAITATPSGVAVGTQGDGLLLWDRRSRTWSRLKVADGLPSDNVTAVLVVDGTLWVGTRHGVTAVDLVVPTAGPGGAHNRR
jgi:ligand-binding sensor domain-containing protein